MCVIIYLEKTSGELDKKDANIMLDYAIDNSKSNSDGYGIINDKLEVYKKPKQLTDKKALYKYIVGKKWALLHLRLATEGRVDIDNTQPIMSDNSIILHNGQFNNPYASKELTKYKAVKSDTRHFTEYLEACIKDKHKVNALKEALKKENNGWYKLFMINKDNGKLYFASNTGGFNSVYFDSQNLIFGATNLNYRDSGNVSVKGVYTKKHDKAYSYSPDTDTIYRVNGLMWAKAVDIPQEKSYKYIGYGTYNDYEYEYDKYGGYTKKEKEPIDICEYEKCIKPAYDVNLNGFAYCKDHEHIDMCNGALYCYNEIVFTDMHGYNLCRYHYNNLTIDEYESKKS